MLAGAADHCDDQRRACQPLALKFDLVGCGVRAVGAEARRDFLAGGEPRVPFEHDEAPGREFAMVWYPGRDREQQVDLSRRWCGTE